MIRPIGKGLALAGYLVLTPALGFAHDTTDPVAPSPEHTPVHFYVLPALIVLTIIAALLFAAMHEKRKQELIARFIDKGQEIPPTLLPAPTAQRDTRRGIWLTSFALGLGLVLYLATGELRAAVWGLLPLFLAAASFVNAALFRARS
jgi:hypothetical protein